MPTPLSLSTVAALMFAATPLAGHAAETPPDIIHVTGTVRDFQQTHPDFNVTPAEGLGHCAGNVLTTLGTDDNPVYSGTGYKVATQWTDSTVDPIAPHLFSAGGGNGDVLLANSPQINNDPVLDTWNSALGPYGGGNVGPAPSFVTGSTMPEVTIPSGLPWIDEVRYDGNGTSTHSGSVHCSKFEIKNNHTVNISGNVVVVADELFKVDNYGTINLLPGATLDVYILKDGGVTNNADVNVNTGDPSLVTFYQLFDQHFKISNNVNVYGRVFAPDATLEIENNASLYGNYTGRDILLKNQAAFHVDTNTGAATMMCGAPLSDIAGTAGVASTGGITAGFTFDDWFNDILGTNFADAHTIALQRDANGVYEYMNDEFYPIDGRLFGNENDDHNRYFTYELTVDFVFNECAGQFIEFSGTDSTWVYVDGFLGIDLGGVQPASSQHVELDRLDLVDGEVYKVKLFYAHRYGSPAFNLRTNVQFIGDMSAVVAAAPWD